MSCPKYSLPVVLAGLLPLAGCRHEAPRVEDVRPVRTVTVAAPRAPQAANYSGTIRARRELAQGFLVAGRVQQRLVEVGERVAADQPLLALDPADATLNMKAADAQSASARAQLAQARNDLARYEALAKKNYVGKSEMEQARLQVETARQNVEAADAERRLARNQSAYTTLRASRAGVVTAIDVEVGSVVQAGQVAVHLAEGGERELEVSVPESRVGELRDARSLSVALWADGSRRYPGRLRELAPDTDDVTRTYAARISVVDADEALALGMTASLSVELARDSALRELPLTALRDADGTPTVWVVDTTSSRVAMREVSLAGVRKDAVLVQRGLADGEVVVTAGANLLHESQAVRLAESQRATPAPMQVAER
jgi:membrane fusion protein, multidrug efflux system